MNGRYKTVFRGLVLAQWALTLLSLAGSVPPELQDRANQSFVSDPTPFHIFLGVACGLGVLKIVAAIGLLFFKRWARPLFAALAVLGVLAPFLVGVLPAEFRVSDPPLAQSVAILLSMLDGAIVALAYAPGFRGLFRAGATSIQPEVGAG